MGLCKQTKVFHTAVYLFPGDLCQRVARGTDAGLYESVSNFSQLVGQVLIDWQIQPHHTGACFTHKSEVRAHTRTFSRSYAASSLLS